MADLAVDILAGPSLHCISRTSISCAKNACIGIRTKLSGCRLENEVMAQVNFIYLELVAPLLSEPVLIEYHKRLVRNAYIVIKILF